MNMRKGNETELALALEGRTKAARGDTRSLLSLAGNLAMAPDPVIDPDFAARLEATLLAEYDSIFATRPTLTLVRSVPEQTADDAIRQADVVRLPRRRHAVRRSLVAVAAAASLAALPVAASASSLPGDPLHGVKRGIEKINLAVFGTPLEDGFFRMELSHRRATELTQLVALHGSQEDIAAAARMAREELVAGQALVFANTDDPAELTRLASMARLTEETVRSAGIGAAAVAAPVIEVTEQIQRSVADALGVEQLVAFHADAPSAPQVLRPDEAAGAAKATAPATQPDAKASGSGSGSDSSKESDPTGTAKNVSDAADDGCEVVGSAQGLGDFLTVVTRATCN